MGNPVRSMLMAGNSLSNALQRQQQKESTDYLSRVIANGGNQKTINNALNMGVGNGVDPKLMAMMRGTTPDADKAAAYKSNLDNLKLIADTMGVKANTSNTYANTARTRQLTRQGTADYKNAQALKTAQILGLTKPGEVIPAVPGKSGNPVIDVLSPTPVQFNTPMPAEPAKEGEPVPFTNMTPDALKYTLENKQEQLKSKLKINEQKPKNGMVHTMAKNMMENAYASGDPVKIAEAEKNLEQYSMLTQENLSSYRREAKTPQQESADLDANLKLQAKKDILKDAKKHSPEMYQASIEYMNRNKDNLDPSAIKQMREGSFIPDQLNEAERAETRAIIDDTNIDTNIANFLGDATGQELMRSAFADMARHTDMVGLKDPAGNTQAIKKVFERYGIEFGGDETWDLGKDVEVIPGRLMDRVQKNRLSSDIVKARKDKERKEQKGLDTKEEDALIKKYQIQLAKEFGVTENIINFVNNIN